MGMYDLQALSPLDFEELVRDLLQAEFKIRFESFGPGPDLGIDFRSSSAGGSTIVQAKHYGRSGYNDLIKCMDDENKKISRLSPLPSRYILATSVSLSPSRKARLIRAMPSAPLVESDILGLEDINNMIRRNRDIEVNHFKLWLTSSTIMERILKSGIYNRTHAEMQIIRDVVPRFVQNNSVGEAEEILRSSGSLIISGEPGVGKTTLARVLVWLHAAQNWRIFVVDNIRDAFEVANEGEKRLIFFDDFLGQVQLSADFVRGMDQSLPPFLDRVRRNRNLRFILTTRDYILSQAQALSGRLGGQAIDSRRFVLDVGSFTRGVRAKILYNHLYFSDLPIGDINSLISDDYFMQIIDHRNFNPRLIQVLTSGDYAAVSDEPIRAAVKRILDDPRELWDRPYRSHFSREARALMLALLLHRRGVPLPILQESFSRMCRGLELGIPKADLHSQFRGALKELEGSVLAIVDRRGRFSNPGVRDYLEATVLQDETLQLVMEYIESLDELSRCWEMLNSRTARSPNSLVSESVWLHAFDRIARFESGTALERLEIAIQIYEKFSTDAALQRVTSACQSFAESMIDHTDATSIRWALEGTVTNRLPIDELEAVRDAVTHKAAQLLKEFGFCLPLDELDALDDALQEFGSDKALADAAIHAGLTGFVKSLDDHLGDLGSIEDLESFEHDLNRLMKRRSFFNPSVARDIEYKRERLEDGAGHRTSSGYSSRQSPILNSGGSSDEIRSIFRSLWRS